MSLSSLLLALGLMFISVSDPPLPPNHTESDYPPVLTSSYCSLNPFVGNPLAYSLYKSNRVQFTSNVHLSVTGGSVDGVFYKYTGEGGRKRSRRVEEEVDMSQQSLECMRINEGNDEVRGGRRETERATQ